jgi:hypothetical protein
MFFASGLAVKWRVPMPGSVLRVCSTARPSRFHFGRPPSSTAAFGWPIARIIHKPRAAE